MKNNILIGIGIVINVVAWGIFVNTGEHEIEFFMGLACIIPIVIGIITKFHYLTIVSVGDALWMLGWGTGFFSEFLGW